MFSQIDSVVKNLEIPFRDRRTLRLSNEARLLFRPLLAHASSGQQVAGSFPIRGSAPEGFYVEPFNTMKTVAVLTPNVGQQLGPSALGQTSRPARCSSPIAEVGGADRDRTGDPLLAKQVLSQLSYSPMFACLRLNWWAWVESNYRPHPYQGCALTN